MFLDPKKPHDPPFPGFRSNGTSPGPRLISYLAEDVTNNLPEAEYPHLDVDWCSRYTTEEDEECEFLAREMRQNLSPPRYQPGQGICGGFQVAGPSQTP